MIRPWHRRCIGVSKAPRVEQPVVPAVRKPFSNNNENNIFDGIEFVRVCIFVNRKTPFPFNSKIIFGSRIKIIVKLNPFYLSTSVPFTSEKCHEFPKFHFKKTSFLFLFIKDSLKKMWQFLNRFYRTSRVWTWFRPKFLWQKRSNPNATRFPHHGVKVHPFKTTTARLVTRFHGEEENGSWFVGIPNWEDNDGHRSKWKTRRCSVEAWEEYAAKLSSNPVPFVKFPRINIAMATLERKFLRWKARRTC